MAFTALVLSWPKGSVQFAASVAGVSTRSGGNGRLCPFRASQYRCQEQLAPSRGPYFVELGGESPPSSAKRGPVARVSEWPLVRPNLRIPSIQPKPGSARVEGVHLCGFQFAAGLVRR